MEQLDNAELLFLLRNGLGKAEKKYKQYTRDQLKDIISSELRGAAGNNFANFFRLEHEFPYKQILIFVAEKLSKYRRISYRPDDHHSEEEIEKDILRLFELRTKEWWKKLGDAEKQQFADLVSHAINAELVDSVNKKNLIKHRVKKEVVDSIITKGIVVGMVAVSAGGMLGVLGGSVLTRIGWTIIVHTKGAMTAAKILTAGAGSASGKAVLDIIGALAAGISVFVPSTIYFYADTNYKKIIPTIIMLLSKVHLNKIFSHEYGKESVSEKSV